MHKRIFLLDTPVHYQGKGSVEMEEGVITFPDDLYPMYMWYFPMRYRQTIFVTDTVNGSECDLIILGNNNGGGVKIADFISAEKRPYVIVVSQLPLNESEQSPYREKSICRFDVRENMRQIITK